jgi:hypothetical protein
MTKQSAMVTAGALVLGMLAGVVGHDLTRQPPPQGPQIVIQIAPGGSTVPVPTTAPTRQGERG